jgi:hypothetical protein
LINWRFEIHLPAVSQQIDSQKWVRSVKEAQAGAWVLNSIFSKQTQLPSVLRGGWAGGRRRRQTERRAFHTTAQEPALEAAGALKYPKADIGVRQELC